MVFPQDWYEWRDVMPLLAEQFHVVAVDLRGAGGSDAPPEGYDAATLADDLAALVEGLDLGSVHVVGHDVGADVPLLLVGGEQVFGPTMTVLADHLRAERGWTDVDAVTLAGARHHLPEDRPAEVADLVAHHARR